MDNSAKIALLDKEVNIRLARLLFWEFCLHMNASFFITRSFLDEVAEAFQWLYEQYCDGKAVRVSVSMPPRAGKSYITTLFCCWWLGKFPTLSVMRNACTARLYEKFSRDARAIIQTKEYLQVFPHVRLHPNVQALEGWMLTESIQMGYFGAGVDGTVIGFGANLAVSDDLYKSFRDAASGNNNEKVHEWKESAHDSRFEGVCPEIFIGTRWLKKDVIGVAIEKGKIHKEVKIPALNEAGETFCAAVRTTEQYLETKADIDGVIWEAEYQQEPGDVAGALFPKSQLQFYNPDTFNEDLVQHRFVPIDPADKGGDDLAAPLCWLVGTGREARIYVPRVICNNYGVDVTEQSCADFITDNQVNAVRVEANGAWELFAKAVKALVLENNGDVDYRTLSSATHKGTRILAQSGFIRNRFIFNKNYADDKDYKRFMKVMFEYLREGGDAQADDAPDSLAMASKYYRTQFYDLFYPANNKNDNDESERDNL